MLAQPHLSKVRKLIAVEMALHPPNNETFSNKFETSLWMKRATIAECAARTVLKAINANGMSWCLPLGVAFLDKRRRKKHFHNKNIYSLVIILSMTPQQQIKASLERSFHLRSRHEMWDVCKEWDGKERTETLRPVNMSPKSQKWVRSVRDAELSMQITLREHNGNEGEPNDKHKQNISIKGQAGIDKVSSWFGKNSRLQKKAKRYLHKANWLSLRLSRTRRHKRRCQGQYEKATARRSPGDLCCFAARKVTLPSLLDHKTIKSRADTTGVHSPCRVPAPTGAKDKQPNVVESQEKRLHEEN